MGPGLTGCVDQGQKNDKRECLGIEAPENLRLWKKILLILDELFISGRRNSKCVGLEVSI